MIGILALQGDVVEHANKLAERGIPYKYIRYPEHLEGIKGLILPGGESTTLTKLIRLAGLVEPLKKLIKTGLPVWGTCAGVILLSKGGILECIDVNIERNAYGAQLDSFVKNGSFLEKQIPMVFIRAPRITRVNDSCEILSELDGHIVSVRSGNILLSTFHPELTDNPVFIDYFLSMVNREK
ncbi:MAG TPA: pyridoxal 5'-phosphate synthase glutaminase subunit PdxT [Desulfomonilia bacterium]